MVQQDRLRRQQHRFFGTLLLVLIRRGPVRTRQGARKSREPVTRQVRNPFQPVLRTSGLTPFSGTGCRVYGFILRVRRWQPHAVGLAITTSSRTGRFSAPVMFAASSLTYETIVHPSAPANISRPRRSRQAMSTKYA